MSKYDNSFTDELRSRLSIVDVVGKRVPLVKKGQNYWGCCPFHNEKTPSFSVNEEKGFYHCFGCAEHGDIISFTMKSNNMDFKSALAELAQMAGIKMPDYKPKTPEQTMREQTYTQIYADAAKMYQEKLFSDVGADTLAYIRGRGFTDEMIRKYKIGFAPKSNSVAARFSTLKESALIATGLVRRGDYGLYDFFRSKLMFPITNAKGDIVAFSGRSMDGSEPKYVNTADTELFHKRATIFGLSYARDAIHRNNRSIVVEGQIDAIQMQSHGFEETVAPLGTALTEDHVAILCKHNRNIIFCFDGDGAGQKAATRALEIVAPFLRDNSDVKFAFMPEKTDPDDLIRKGRIDTVKKVIDSAIDYTDFLFASANAKYNTRTDSGQAQAHKYLMSVIDKIGDDDRKAAARQYIKDKEWNDWHRNFKKSKEPEIFVPKVDQITQKNLAQIIETFPDLAEKHFDFLSRFNIEHDHSAEQTGMSAVDAEKFILALKLQTYIDQLQDEKKELLKSALSGENPDISRIATIDSELKKAIDNLTKLGDI